MFEIILSFLKELLFKDEILDIRNYNFNLGRLFLRGFVILSFVLNYFLINRYIRLADYHYKLEVAVVKLMHEKKDCIIVLPDVKPRNPSSK
jgi:hypothetical protein